MENIVIKDNTDKIYKHLNKQELILSLITLSLSKALLFNPIQTGGGPYGPQNRYLYILPLYSQN